MRACNLVPVRFQIVDEALAVAACLAQRLLGAGRDRARGKVIVAGRREGVVIVAVGVAVTGRVSRAVGGAALDEPLMQAEVAVLADRDDSAGALTVLIRVDGKA